MHERTYVCPKCAASHFKVADSTKPGDYFVNAPEFVNSTFECMQCGYIGTFPIIHKDKLKDFKKKFKRPS